MCTRMYLISYMHVCIYVCTHVCNFFEYIRIYLFARKTTLFHMVISCLGGAEAGNDPKFKGRKEEAVTASA